MLQELWACLPCCQIEGRESRKETDGESGGESPPRRKLGVGVTQSWAGAPLGRSK